MVHHFSPVSVSPDWEAFLSCIRRRGTPRRVHNIELFLDGEVKNALCERFALLDDLSRDDPFFEWQREIRIQRFLGYDYVSAGVGDFVFPLKYMSTTDTAPLAREGGRFFVDLARGPITTWEEFEAYPWPAPERTTTRALEWYSEHLPDDMCIIGFGSFGHPAEHLSWLMGYETLCFALHDQRDLVAAISEQLRNLYRAVVQRILAFERVRILWGSDDMGFRSGTLISPDDLRQFVLPIHKELAQMAHTAGRPYLLHSCGNLAAIMDDLIDDVRIDAKHSFEDTIEEVTIAKERYGDRITLLGGIDVDFLCRAHPDDVRRRVRRTLDLCLPGGGYCLGTGNSVANYVPIDNYLAMLDEGRRYAA